MKKIFFTGGGSAGHVTPNIALIEHLLKKGWTVAYVGSNNGIERGLMERLSVPYYGVSTGKIRRYFAWKNFLDPFLVIIGIFQSLILCHSYKPDLVFSKGGFVAVPVVIGAWICRIPVICHESDITPGLANRLCFPFCEYVCINFPQTERFLPRRVMGERTKVTGSPIRQSVLKGNAAKGRQLLGFSDKKPVLLVFGGGLGSKQINKCIRQCRFQLLRYYQIIHVVGEGNLEPVKKKEKEKGYVQKEYLHDDFGNILAAANLVVSRAGANSIYEFLVLRKSHLLVPLSKKASRGDQITNAKAFERAGISMVVQEVDLTAEGLIASLNKLIRQRKTRLAALKKFKALNAVKIISKLIDRVTR